MIKVQFRLHFFSAKYCENMLIECIMCLSYVKERSE